MSDKEQAARFLAVQLGPTQCPGCVETGKVIDYWASTKAGGQLIYMDCPQCRGRGWLCRGCTQPLDTDGALCSKCQDGEN